MTKGPSIIVIGAGIGGIAAAAHLARRGLQVTVYEKNGRPGGRCDRFSQEGHSFDTGPTLLVMPLVYEAEFAALGASLHELLDLRRVDPTYRLVFDDGRQLALTSDLKAMEEQLEAIEPGSFAGFLRYLEEGHRHYHVAMERLVQRDFRTAADFFTLENLPLLFHLKPLAHHYRHMAAYFTHPRLKAAFTFQDVYMGLSPFEAPATFSMMPYTELAHGVWYPRGGMYRVVEALVNIARQAGVEFGFDAAVERIDVNGHCARGVTLAGGRQVAAGAIIANADLPYVYQQLLPQDGAAGRLAGKRFSCSTITFFWGVDQVVETLGPHTLFLADDYQGNFESIIKDLTLPENPSLYIHAPARLDPAMAPPGQDTLIAIVPVGHLDERGRQEWPGLRQQARQAVFRRLATLGITGLEAHLKFETNFTPLSWRKRYNLMKGSTHGLGHTLAQLGYLRPHNRHARYHNLYFVGASTHPGTGVPTALVSGRLVAERLLEEFQVLSQ
ncbi:MAG: phytoene desaturase family protein [Chloroflexi bacterium]|nr:phytoene desaturase family protein [Chloroflexota bacterium]MCI0649098.1 phytoene desaturase family protein [Chloroflexota bacterium]MCI0727000.1 phytoene desaturase family protein [Chloroflexota bacterium]